MKLYRYIFTVLCILCFYYSPAHGTGSAPKRHIIMLVDFSESVANIEHYWKSISLVTGCANDTKQSPKKMCSKLQEGDMITIVKITGESGRRTEIISKLSIDKIGLDENDEVYKKRIGEGKRTFVAETAAGLSIRPTAKKTEILSAIRTAKQYFDNGKADKKILVILSDMIEDSEYAKFENNKINPAAIIDKEKREKRLPDLNGIKVFISGATARTDQKFNEIKNFWVEYFKSTNAIFNESSYFSEMPDFNE